MAVVTITKENFEQEVLQSTKPVLLDFWASWCVRLWVPARRPVCWTCWDEICLKRSCCIRCGGSFFPALCTNAQKNHVIKQKTLALSYFTTLSG